MESKNYKEDLKIDIHSLEIEWHDQPLKYCKWAEQAAEASYAYDLEKEKLDVLLAEKERQIRKDPESYGIEKLTDGAVKWAVSVDATVQTAKRRVIDAKRNLRLFEAAERSFDHRKRALESLTKLYTDKYYASPRIPGQAKAFISAENESGSIKALQEAMKDRKLSRRTDADS